MFYIDNALESLSSSGLIGLIVNDDAPASPSVLWTSVKMSSMGSSAKAFAKFSATSGYPLGPITFDQIIPFQQQDTPQSNASVNGNTVSNSSGIITLTSNAVQNTIWKITFNPSYLTGNVKNMSAQFQLYNNNTMTYFGNGSALFCESLANQSNGIIEEFVDVPASSNTSIQANIVSSTAFAVLGSQPNNKFPTIIVEQVF